VFRSMRLVLSLVMIGCAQHVAPFAPTGSQPMMRNAGANSIKPAESVTAFVKLKNELYTADGYPSEFTVYYSYRLNPFWHKEAEACVKQGREFDTKVVYNHIKEGPQIRFVAKLGNPPFRSCFLTSAHRAVTFHGMVFDPNAHFHAIYRAELESDGRYRVLLCAHGGGNKETCDSRV
jgi:hypothetical protein